MEKLESLVPVVAVQSKKVFKTKGRHISVATAKEDSQTDVLTKLQHEALTFFGRRVLLFDWLRVGSCQQILR